MAQPKIKLQMGWVRDLPDHRDFLYSASPQTLRTLPPMVDLRGQFKVAPYDQGHIGSCTANAIAGAIQFDRERAKLQPDWVPSRLFIYYNERSMEHSVALDAGAQLRDGVKSVAKLGVCPEDMWPYDNTPADEATHLFPPGAKAGQKPTPQCYTEALKHKVISYFRVTQSLAQLKGCLVEGFPFTFGFTVYDSLYDNEGKPKKLVPLPGPGDSLLGGHAVLCVGYNDAQQLFSVRNSWGPASQEEGYFYLPYAYLTDPNLAADFWTLRAVAG